MDAVTVYFLYMTYDDTLKKEGSFRKAASSLSLTKSKFVRLWKIELSLCQRRTSCRNKPEENKTACRTCLDYVGTTRDPIKKKEAFKKYREKNKIKLTEYNKKYQKANLQKYREYNKKRRNTPEGKALGAAKSANRRASKYLATPKWTDKKALKEIYKKCPKGFHVDHIIPLINEKICGLHVPWNLQHLTAFDNDSKGNSFDGTYDNLYWKSNICHQYLMRLKTQEEDKNLGLPFDLAVKDFQFSNEKTSLEIKDFIKKYEWLGTLGYGTKWAFTARYKGKLAGVVLMSEPVNYIKLNKDLGQKVEALIQRGAAASWAPKNLNSALVMFSCRWMVNNTDKRVFTAYSDPDANEIGTIYQACNFNYLGCKFGNKVLLTLPSGKKVGSRYFTKSRSLKNWAKELGIEWKREWDKDNRYVNLKALPLEIKKILYGYAKSMKDKCKQEKDLPKGKYILFLGKDRREQRFLDKLKTNLNFETYPKRS